MSRKQVSLLFLAIGAGALVLLAYKIGWDTISESIVAFAPAFPIILAIEATSNILSTVGWYYSFTPADRPGLVRLQLINFASLPLSGALPTGQASEVLKANLLRGAVSGSDIVSSLVLYNYLHVTTTALVMVVGPLLAFAYGGFPAEAALVLLVVALGIFGLMALLGLFLRLGVFVRVARLLARLPVEALKSDRLVGWASDIDARMTGMWRERPRDLVAATGFLIVARLVQIAEVYVILSWLPLEASMTMAAMAFSGTALANYLLMALPAREGFLEGSAYVVFEAIGLPGVHGFTLELIRRVRKIAYQLFGLVLLAVLSRDAGAPPEPAQADDDSAE